MNNLKTFGNANMALMGLMAAGNSTSILVIDKNGNPLVGAHLKWAGGGVITDHNGEATVSVPSSSTQITITYMGKRSHIASFSDLVNAMVTLQDNTNNLPPVVIGGGTKPTPKPPAQATVTKSNTMTYAAFGIGIILLLAMMKKKGSGLNAPKPKAKGKAKKTTKKAAKKTKSKKNGLRQPYEIEL